LEAGLPDAGVGGWAGRVARAGAGGAHTPVLWVRQSVPGDPCSALNTVDDLKGQHHMSLFYFWPVVGRDFDTCLFSDFYRCLKNYLAK
jgi:hypothetical protein